MEQIKGLNWAQDRCLPYKPSLKNSSQDLKMRNASDVLVPESATRWERTQAIGMAELYDVQKKCMELPL